jgi:hypothetical protein
MPLALPALNRPFDEYDNVSPLVSPSAPIDHGPQFSSLDKVLENRLSLSGPACHTANDFGVPGHAEGHRGRQKEE